VREQNGPVAIRYPRGGDRGNICGSWNGSGKSDPVNGLQCHRRGKDVTIITYGTLVHNAMAAAELLAERGIEATVLRLQSIKPLPMESILQNLLEQKQIFVLEETAAYSGIREVLAWELQKRLPQSYMDGADLGDQYITHGTVEELYQHYGLDGRSVAEKIMEVRKVEK